MRANATRARVLLPWPVCVCVTVPACGCLGDCTLFPARRMYSASDPWVRHRLSKTGDPASRVMRAFVVALCAAAAVGMPMKGIASNSEMAKPNACNEVDTMEVGMVVGRACVSTFAELNVEVCSEGKARPGVQAFVLLQ